MRCLLISVLGLRHRPLITAQIWMVATYFIIGFLGAYAIGVRPQGILVWSEGSLLHTTPPGDMPLFVEIGPHKGLIYFAQLREIGIQVSPDGWYSLLPSDAASRPSWLGQHDSTVVPSEIHTPEHPYLGDTEIYLISVVDRHTQSTSTFVDSKYMFLHGQKYRVQQELRDGLVRPLKAWIVPDSMPLAMSILLYPVLCLIVSVIPMIIMGFSGYILSYRCTPNFIIRS